VLDKLLSAETVSDPTEITPLGQVLSKLPLSPRFAKMMIVSTKYSVLRYMIMIVACLSVAEIFKEVKMIIIEPKVYEEEVDTDLITTIDL
jgi:ATP-dependent RNA helicase DHX37/DHR1